MRTEIEILRDFEEFGYKIYRGENEIFIYELYIEIEIDFELKEYQKQRAIGVGKWVSCCLTLKEHKLLHELFELWGWL